MSDKNPVDTIAEWLSDSNIPLLGIADVDDIHPEGKLLLIYICNFHVLSKLLLIYICKLHWKLEVLESLMENSIIYKPKDFDEEDLEGLNTYEIEMDVWLQPDHP
jgi:hypothetical protein